MASNFFKLKKLNIRGYKNISNLDIDFSEKNGTTVLIGQNGCGKSNVLEAISSIFAGLYKNRFHKPDFEYTINYEINGYDIEIDLTKSVYSIKVNGATWSKTAFQHSVSHFLPRKTIACYSGECQRLWGKYYKPYYDNYCSIIKKLDAVPELPMLYIDKRNLAISLLTLFFFDFNDYTDIKEFCNTKLNIKEIRDITFSYNLQNVKKWNDNSVIFMIKRLNTVIQRPVMFANEVTLSLPSLKESLSYLDEREFFKTLYAATMLEKDSAIADITYDIVLNNGDVIGIDDLSEGEKKNLLIKTILEALADENSLLLFDEPDSHIHISRKAELKDLFEKYHNRESILTTHSPTLAVKFEGHIEGLGTDEHGNTVKIDSDKAALVSAITGNLWNVHEQNMFLASSKPMTLLVEGKTDKVHIEEAFKKLKNDFPDLNFDVFSMNGSEHIRETLIGLSCSEIEWNKKFVGLFDNDDAGIKDTKNGFEKDATNNGIKHVKYGDRPPSNCFYALLLPKKDEFGAEAFTIENCYLPEKYQEALKQAMAEKEGHFEGLSIDRIANDLKNKAKTILAEQAKSFDETEFDGFKPLFGLIEEIRKL